MNTLNSDYKIILLLTVSMLSACSSQATKHDNDMTLEKSNPPQLWSFHKSLSISVDVCALKGYSALKSLEFSGVVQNGNYSYGNFNENRAAVKCVEISNGSLVYLAVAGPERDVVEKLRNEIAWKY